VLMAGSAGAPGTGIDVVAADGSGRRERRASLRDHVASAHDRRTLHE
jgi:hypothetical protein